MVVHGGSKVGKSTFAAGAPAPIFIQTEDGLNGIDTLAFPLAGTLQDVLDALDVLVTQQHEFKTVVLDSCDWLERLIHEKVCGEGVKNINKADGGYGNGYITALSHWREVLDKLNLLNRQCGMVVILICHSSIVKFNDPVNEPYDIYQLKLHTPGKGTGAGNLVQEWADVIGYASKPILVQNKGNDQNKIMRASEVKTAGGQSAGHLLHLVGQPAYTAGNRYSLPPTIPLTWQAFQAAMSATTQPPQRT